MQRVSGAQNYTGIFDEMQKEAQFYIEKHKIRPLFYYLQLFDLELNVVSQ